MKKPEAKSHVTLSLYKVVSFNEEYSTHGSGEFILLSVVHGDGRGRKNQ
jgi:hypothetical protein